MKKICVALILILILNGLPVFAGLAADSQETADIIILEAESGILDDTSRFAEQDSQEVSGGKYIQAKSSSSSAPSQSEIPALSFTVTTTQDGYYNLWFRIRSPYSYSNSIWVQIDGGAYTQSRFAVVDKWNWQKGNRLWLTAGTHTVGLIPRTAQICVDKLVLTSQASYIPFGTSGENGFNPNEDFSYLYAVPTRLPPANTHPRVMVNAESLTKIRGNLTHSSNQAMYEWVQYYANLNRDGTLSKGPLITDNASATVLGVASSNAFLYLLNGDETSGRKAVSVIRNYLSDLILVGNAYPTREAGYTIYVTAQVYDWCYDLLSMEERGELIGHIVSLASAMEVGWPAINGGNFVGHTCEAQIFRDLFAAAIAIYDEYPAFYNMIGGRLEQEMIPARNKMYEGGYFTEGSGYGSYRYFYEMYCTLLYDAIGYKNVFDESQRYLIYEMIYNCRPDGKQLNYGDDSTTRELVGKESFFLAANYYKDEYLNFEYRKRNPQNTNQFFGDSYISPVLHLLINDPELGMKNTEALPLAAYYEGSNGTMLTRTSWSSGSDADTALVRMNFQKKFIGSHQHADSGSFDIYLKGSLALDSGLYHSEPWTDENGNQVTNLDYGSEHDLNYHKLSIAHNTMLIQMPGDTPGYPGTVANDGGQKAMSRQGAYYSMNTQEDWEDPQWQVGEILGKDIGSDMNRPSYSYLKGDLTKAYHSAKLENYIRSFLFLNLFDTENTGILLVFDNIKTTDPSYQKTFLLHSEEEPVISGSETTVTRNAAGKLVNQTLLPANAVIRKVGGEGNEFLSDGVNYKAVPAADNLEEGKWRTEISPAAENRQDYFLNVIQFGENGVMEAGQASLVRDDELFAGVSVKGKTALFAKQEDFAEDFTLEQTDGETFISGLAEGKWTVSRNGTAVGEYPIISENDLLRLEAVPGTYTLSLTAQEVQEKDLFFLNHIADSEDESVILNLEGKTESFRQKPIVSGETALFCAEEYLEKLGDTPEKLTDSYLKLRCGNRMLEFYAGDSYAYSNGEAVLLETIPLTVDGKLFIPIFNMAGYMETNISQDGLVFSVTKRAAQPEHPVGIFTQTEGGTVSGRGIVIAEDGMPIEFDVEPDPGYYVKRVEMDGEELWVYQKEGATHLRTPALSKDVSLHVAFEKWDGMQPEIFSVPLRVKAQNRDYHFFRLVDHSVPVQEYGILYSRTKTELTADNAHRLPYIEELASHQYFGFELIDAPAVYTIRPYVIYGENEIAYGETIRCVRDENAAVPEFSTEKNGEIVLTDDGYTDASLPDANYGSNTRLNIMYPGKWNTQYIRNGFLQFDISQVKQVDNGRAYLRLYASNTQPSRDCYLGVYETDGTTFDESTLTSSNQPGIGKCIGVQKIKNASYKAYLYDVTDYLKRCVEQGKEKISFAVGISKEYQYQQYPNGNSNFYVSVVTKENLTASKRPCLYIDDYWFIKDDETEF